MIEAFMFMSETFRRSKIRTTQNPGYYFVHFLHALHYIPYSWQKIHFRRIAVYLFSQISIFCGSLASIAILDVALHCSGKS